jgi:hypothetical protein
MAVADDDYRKRLAERLTQGTEATSNPIGAAYARGFEYLGKSIKDLQNPFMRLGEDIAEDNKGAVALTLGTAGMGGKGKGARRLVDQIPTPVLQRAIQAAAMEGKQLGGKWVEEGASQGVKFGQSGVARAGRAGEDALFEIIDDFERMGADARTLTRYLKGFAKYADDPFEAMESMGENMMRETKGFKEALIDRTYRRIGDAAERAFF